MARRSQRHCSGKSEDKETARPPPVRILSHRSSGRNHVLRAEKISVEGKQLTGQTGRVVGIGWEFSPDVVIEHAALGGLMDMRLVQVHAVALDSVGDAADEDHGAIRFQPFDDSHMGQGIVQLAVSVEIPCIIKKHEIAGVDVRLSMKRAMPAHVVVDESDAVSLSDQ